MPHDPFDRGQRSSYLNPSIDPVNVTLAGLVWPEVGNEWIQETLNRIAGLFRAIKTLEIQDGSEFMKEIVDTTLYPKQDRSAFLFTCLKDVASWPYNYYHGQGDLRYMLDRPYASSIEVTGKVVLEFELLFKR